LPTLMGDFQDLLDCCARRTGEKLAWVLMALAGTPHWDARFRHIMLVSGGYSLGCLGLAFLTSSKT
jgi:hypothetical protein